jgi:Ni2+-binding GTPase involved in maturation of urease and hydrogenase
MTEERSGCYDETKQSNAYAAKEADEKFKDNPDLLFIKNVGHRTCLSKLPKPFGRPDSASPANM